MRKTPVKNDNLRVPYALAVHGIEEEKRVLKVLREHRTIIGPETNEFETRVAKHFGKKYAVMVNSGSSANLLALEALGLPKGSEVITPILTFSTTIAPIIQNGLVPVFVDVEEASYLLNIKQVEEIIGPKTKAIMVPLLLGNIPNLEKLKKIAKKHNLLLIEDSCDTFAAHYKNKPTGTYTDITTTSFYGSHIITAGGGGGMVIVNKDEHKNKVKILRGWGRDSSILGETEDIAQRFSKKIGNINYDAKFIFSNLGYNFLPVEMGSAFGNAQLDKLEKFRKIRENNFNQLIDFFKKYENFFILPKQDPLAATQWLAFPLTIRGKAPFKRMELATFLENNNIQTRPIFTGNILKQPGFEKIKHRKHPKGFSVTNYIMEHGLLIGCHHGLEKKHLDKIRNSFTAFLNQFS